ncbi:MAG: hypothetical protein LBR80_18340 [Deltaproteobacteria bacterium]|jgi:hypothetical protein|nr:hypothetical protein [Deltaproteobacteria bacterium]
MRKPFPGSRPLPPVLAAAALALAAFTPFAHLLAQELPPETFENQPPLTAEEAEAGMEILKASMADVDESVVEWIAAKAGMDDARTMYVTTKMMAGFLLTVPGATEEDIAASLGTPDALPTAAERVLVEPHLDAIRLMMGKK